MCVTNLDFAIGTNICPVTICVRCGVFESVTGHPLVKPMISTITTLCGNSIKANSVSKVSLCISVQ